MSTHHTDSKDVLKSVAIAGGLGGLGTFISRAFAARPEFQTRLLLRKGGSSDSKEKQDLLAELKSRGVTTVEVDFASSDSLVAGLKDIDVVISAVAGAEVNGPQLALLEAAKKAGVKRFVPSEFGYHLRHNMPAIALGAFASKLAVRDAIQKSGLSWTIIENDLFDSYAFGSPVAGIDFANKKLTALGSNERLIGFTTRQEIAAFIPDVLLHPASKNAVVRLASDVLSYNQIGELLEQATGQKWSRAVVTTAELKKKFDDSKGADFVTGLQLTASEEPISRDAIFNFKHFPLVKTTSFADAIANTVRPLKKIAIVGATGTTGADFARAALNSKKFSEVRVVVRKATAELKDGPKAKALADFKAAGATIALVDDLKSVDELTKAFDGVDAVLSAAGGTDIGNQTFLIDAAKKANVRRFVPSEFGVNLEHVKTDFFLFAAKNAVADYLKKSGLEYTLVATGCFFQFLWGAPLSIDLASSTVTIHGSKTAHFPSISQAEVGLAVINSLLSPASRNAVIDTFSEITTYERTIPLLESIAGKKFTIKHVTQLDLDKQIAAEKSPYELGAIFGNIKKYVISDSERVAALPAYAQVSFNARQFPEVRFQSLREFLTESLKAGAAKH